MFLMNSSQQNDKSSKAYNEKIIKDIFKISLIVIALKVGTALINKNWWSRSHGNARLLCSLMILYL